MADALDNLFTSEEKAKAAQANKTGADKLDFLFPEHAGGQYMEPSTEKMLHAPETKILGIIPAKSSTKPTPGEEAVVKDLQTRWEELTGKGKSIGERAGGAVGLLSRGSMLHSLLGGEGSAIDPAASVALTGRAQTGHPATGPWVTPSKTGLLTPSPTPGAPAFQAAGAPPGGGPPVAPGGPPAAPPAGPPTTPPTGGAAPPGASPPAGAAPHIPTGFNLADELFKLRQGETADKLQIKGVIDQMPPAFRDQQFQEKLYHHVEDPANNPLTLQEQALKQQFFDRLKALEFNLYERAKLLKGEPAPTHDPTYMRRIATGHAERYSQFGPAPGSQDPIVGGRSITRRAGSLESRGFYALESPRVPGRMVVSPSDTGDMVVWQHRAATRMPISGEVKPGAQVKIGNQTFNVVQATTKEIEQHALHGEPGQGRPASYYKNATVNTLENITHLKRLVRNLEFMERLKREPEWLRLTTTDAQRARSLGWRESKMPAFRGTFMDNKIRHVVDDYYRPGLLDSEAVEAIGKINRFIVGSLFWNPLPHIENVAGHWFVSRGIDWIRPQQYRSLFNDGWRAFNEVRQGGRLYQQLLREGSGLVHGGVANENFYRVMAAKMGMDIEAHPERWGAIARTLGFNKPMDLVASYYRHVRSILWQANDVFMVQRVLELEGKGMARQEAIKEAERDIPNYRIPEKILGSRLLSQLMQDPTVTVFSRYHYGVFKSYAEMLRGITKGNVEDMGKLFALGVLTWGIYPAISYGLSKIAGDERTEKLKRGPAAQPENLVELLGGQKSIGQVLGSALTLSPTVKLGATILGGGHDPFTGQTMYEQGDLREGNYGRVGAQLGEYGLEQMGPYQVLNQMYKGDDGVLGTLGRQIVGTKNVSDRMERGKLKGEKIERRKAIKRANQPHGIFEGLFGNG